MATNSQFSIASRNASLDARAARLANGYVRIYTAAQPANADTAIGAQVLLAEHRFGSPAFAPSANGVATANALATATILATGTPAWFRCLLADGTTVECDGNIGTSAANMIVGSLNYQQGADSNVASLTFTAPAVGT